MGKCEWLGCDEPAVCITGNFHNMPVCAKHLRVTNGPATDPEWAAWWREALRRYWTALEDKWKCYEG